ncbi:hypothetical protein NDU88_000244 [Pleurodeles waltl]|uniref:Uncharacterized protein n=1 Tax=Pleurodeles waltl TaxID=8319 RepID=A0AAV7KMF4_PLEWA|nr:hypothetical protein NDU88_000244 [Pleurodeles waltl]
MISCPCGLRYIEGGTRKCWPAALIVCLPVQPFPLLPRPVRVYFSQFENADRLHGAAFDYDAYEIVFIYVMFWREIIILVLMKRREILMDKF